MTTKQLPVIELTPEGEEWLHQKLLTKGQPGVADVHIPSAIDPKKKKKRRRRLRDLMKHAYKGSQTHSTGTGQEAHGGSGQKFMGGHTEFDVVGSATSEQQRSDMFTATQRLESGQPLYRGIGVVFPDELREELEQILVPAMEPEEIGQHLRAGPMILDYITKHGGVGRHWTTNKGWAELAAGMAGGQGPLGKNQWNVIVEIEPPDASMLNPIQDRLGMSEGEVTLKPDGVYRYTSLVVQGGTWWDNENLLQVPIQKHPYKGSDTHSTGTGQEVHGTGGGGGEAQPDEGAVPVRDRVQKWDTKDLDKFNAMWPTGNAQYQSVRNRTNEGIRRVGELMREDPRWDEANDEWYNLEDDIGPAFDAMGDEAETIQNGFWSAAMEIGLGWEDFENMGQDPTPYDLEQAYEATVIPQGVDVEDQITGLGLELDEIEALIDSQQSVYSSDKLTEELGTVGQWGTTFGWENPRFEVLAVDSETGMVTLRRLSREWDAPDGLGDPTTLGPLLGGPGSDFGSDMGPEVFESHYTKLFTQKADTDSGATFMVIDSDVDKMVFSQIEATSMDWGNFEHTYGVSPPDAISLLEMGDYTQFSGGMNPASSEALIVVDSYEGTGMTVVTSADEVPQALRNLWANTSADEHRWALALQQAVADEFDLDTVPIGSLIGRSESVKRDAATTYDQYGTGLRVYARAVYDATQEYLAENAPFEGALPVVRGMELSETVVKEHYQGIPHARNWNDPTWTPVELTLNPISSFSTNANVARGFAGKSWQGYPSVTRAYVEPKQIWGISILGHGSYKEAEVIVLGGDDSLVGEMKIVKYR